MPIVKREIQLPAPIDFATGNLPQPQLQESPGLLDTIGAAFRTDNIIGAAFNTEGYDGTVDPDYDPWKEIAGTKYEQHWDAFAPTLSRAQGEALKRQIDREEADRQTLEAAGALGVLASMGSTLVDPTILIPIGGAVKKVEGGYSILKSAASVGLTSGLAIGAQEAILQNEQELRSGEESAINIGAGIMLGGLLGGVSSGLLSKGEIKEASRAVDELITGEVRGGGGLSAGERTQITVGDLTVDGRDAQAVARLTQRLSPNLRLQQSPSARSRQLAQELAEGTMYQQMHAEGRTLGPAVETLQRSEMNARLAQARSAQDVAYREMRRSGVKMRWKDFDEAVGKAMRNGDQGENDFISRAAASWRKHVADPYFDQLVRAGVLEEGDRAAFAKSYFPRRYNTDFMIANEPKIKADWTAFMENRIRGQYATAQERLGAKVADLEARINDLNLSAEQRVAVLEEMGAAQATAKEAGEESLVKRLQRRLDDLRTGFIEEEPPLRDPDAPQTKIYRVDEAAVKAAINDLQTEQVKLNRAFADKWEIRHLGEDLEAGGNFSAIAKQIVDDVFDRITGKNYGDSSSVEPEYMMPIARGPVIERTLPIPDELLEKQGVLRNSATDVLTHYARVAGADAHLTERFGKPTLVDQMQEIKDDYRKLREEAASTIEDPAKLQKRLTELNKRERQDVNDLRALRDLVRGTYKAAENASSYGRLARAVNHFNYIRSMGGVVVSSLGDLYRPAMVYGLGRFMREGVAPLLTNLSAVKMSVKEAKLAGQVLESVLQHRMMALAEMGDPFARGNVVENLLENASRIGTKWNGIAYWTDAMKAVTSVIAQNRILDPTTSERTLAFLGIDGHMRERIMREFAAHGETRDGVRIANTEEWTDRLAIQHYRAAVSKDVDSVIVTPGLGDGPLLSKTPLGRMLLQFRSFVFASHQRVLLRGLQEDKTNFLSGLVGLTAIGMMVSALRAWRGGQAQFDKFKRNAENPGYLIGEGLDNTGIFSVPIDIGNTVERLTPSAGFRFNPVKTPLTWGGTLLNPDAPTNTESVKLGNVSPWGALLGPTGGMGEQAFRTAGIATSLAQGEELTPGQKKSAAGLVPYNSYLGMREMLQVLNDDSPYTE